MCMPGNRLAPSTSACFMEPGLSSFQRRSSGTVDASRHTLPVTTGDATLVPACAQRVRS
jgi:hypothetical protein